MLKKIALMLLFLLLSGCLGPVVSQEKALYRCSYRNATTKKMYVFNSRDQFRAVKRAHKACLKDPVKWRCCFDTCVQIAAYIR